MDTTEKSPLLDEKINKTFKEIEAEKERKLLNLIVQIIVEITLKEYYEIRN